jgi:non-heme chloroperoxidase
MNPAFTQSSNTAPADEDLAEQARPGYGIPSQDPRPAAQTQLEPEEAEREAKSALMGGGVIAGAATGAAIGAMVAGPVGVVVGGTLGTVAGALGSAAAGTKVNPEVSSSADTTPADAVRGRTAPQLGETPCPRDARPPTSRPRSGGHRSQ